MFASVSDGHAGPYAGGLGGQIRHVERPIANHRLISGNVSSEIVSDDWQQVFLRILKMNKLLCPGLASSGLGPKKNRQRFARFLGPVKQSRLNLMTPYLIQFRIVDHVPLGVLLVEFEPTLVPPTLERYLGGSVLCADTPAIPIHTKALVAQ